MLSLNGALRTCKVNTGWANRLESDRFQNPNLMVCPTWNGMDNAGRPVAADSFNTKRRGCNSADDRVSVENNLRPQYMEYISLDASGITAPLYGSTNMLTSDANIQRRTIQDVGTITGSFGNSSYPNKMQSTCAIYAMNQGLAQEATEKRMQAQLQNGMMSNNQRQNAGMN
jgi:hypothetical protein